jgi:uncharacterized phage protein (TIGR02218 family)
MSFEDYEDSVEGGKPYELFEFIYQGITARYTSADHIVFVGLVPYAPAAGLMRTTDIEDTGKNVASQNMTIEAYPGFPPSELFSVAPPSDVVNILVKRVQQGDLTDARITWAGRVLSVAWTDDKVKMTCQSLFTRLKQPGLRRLYGKSCPHLLYQQGPGQCNVVAEDFRVPVTISSVSGIQVVSADFDAFPDGYFRGGKLSIETSPGIFEQRGIQLHVGDTVTMTHALATFVPGLTVDAYPGCDKTIQTCHNKFNNVLNFGGTPYIPQKNPFGNNTVF